MPTISGLRRRGYTPESIRDFCERIGVAKADSMVEVGLLEFCIREDLKLKAPRYIGSTRPSKSCHHKLSRRANGDISDREQYRK